MDSRAKTCQTDFSKWFYSMYVLQVVCFLFRFPLRFRGATCSNCLFSKTRFTSFHFASLDPGLRVWQLGFLGLRLGTGQEVGSFRLVQVDAVSVFSGVFRCFQVFSDVFRCFQMFSRDSRSNLLVVRHDRELEKVM
jgi:hypothetical protein